jgi:phosphatidylserine decarboxylase
VISQIGEIQDGKIIQAKNKTYTVEALLRQPKALENYDRGLFVTYYLCPTDYHRVHSPVDGEIVRVTHIPGELWPVNAWSTENIENLFAVNERVIVEIKTQWGLVSLVFVGATNVGKISLSFEAQILTNQSGQTERVINYVKGAPVKKGEELGIFHMGSTVVMCYPIGFRKEKSDQDWHRFLKQKVKIGENFL